MVTAAPLLLLLAVAQVAPAQPPAPGSVWIDEPSPVPAPPAAPPGPTPTPPDAPPAPPRSPPAPGPALIAGGLGIGWPVGTAPGGRSMSQLAQEQLRLALQVGLRASPEVLVGGYLDVGMGAAGDMMKAGCLDAVDAPCSAVSLQVGLLGRYAFTPLASGTPWLSAGAGWEFTHVISTGSSSPTFSGPELRLGAGYDFRNDGKLGYGLFLDGSLGWYSRVSGSGGSSSLSSQPAHGWVTAGVRLLLLP